MIYGNEEQDTLQEVEDWQEKRKKNFSNTVNKRKISKFEMDDFFMGG